MSTSYIIIKFISTILTWIFFLSLLSWIISKVFKISFKKTMIWVVSIVASFFVLMITLFYLMASSEDNEGNVKWHFEYILSVPFPDGAKIDYSDCSSGYSGGGYTCNASIRVPYDTYKILSKKIEDNKSIRNYHQNAKEWHWGLVEDNQTVYFEYMDY